MTATVKLRGKVNFPATVTAEGGFQIVKENGIWTISPKWADLALETTIPDASARQLWTLDPVNNVYARLSVQALIDNLPAGPEGPQGVPGDNGANGTNGSNGAGYGGTSTTSLLIANSVTKVFTTQAGLAYQVGNYARASSAANGANFMEGTVSAYAGTSLSIAVTKIGGSGTYADWAFQIAGAPGTGDLLSTNNLSDVSSKKTALDNLSVHGADVASATTTNLETATGDLVDVTGTTAITTITLSEGHERTVRFTGILTLTHGASLVLPGAASITTAAGDMAVFRGYAAGVVRCVGYTKISGKPVVFPTPSDINAAALAGNQALTGGFTSASVSAGTKTTGTYTFDPTAGAVQHATNGGAHTFAPPATMGAWMLDYVNNASAGALTTSGWTKVDGDTFTTTNGNSFRCMLSVGNQGSYLSVKRMV